MKREPDIIVLPDGRAQHHLRNVFSKRIKNKKADPGQVFKSNYKCTGSSGKEECIKYHHSIASGKVQSRGNSKRQITQFLQQ